MALCNLRASASAGSEARKRTIRIVQPNCTRRWCISSRSDSRYKAPMVRSPSLMGWKRISRSGLELSAFALQPGRGGILGFAGTDVAGECFPSAE